MIVNDMLQTTLFRLSEVYHNHVYTELCTPLTYIQLTKVAAFICFICLENQHTSFESLYFQAGFLLKYNFESGEDEEVDIHTARLNIFSPFDALKLLDITTFIELQDKFYNSSFTLLTEQSHFTAGGDVGVMWSCVAKF